MQTSDPALLAADPAEVSDHLLDAGLTDVRTLRQGDVLDIMATQGDAAISAALVGWAPTTTGYASWDGRLPAYLFDHIQHMRDYRQAVRDGQAVTNAQTTHVIADIIDALRFLNRRVTSD